MADQSPAAPSDARAADDVGGVIHGRSTKFIEYDYEVCPQVPSLHCKNGSTCAPGIGFFGKHDHLDLPTQDSGYYCKCLDGFIGHECGIEVEDCDLGTEADPNACYNGSKCRSNGSGENYCDCKGLNEGTDPTELKFEGLMCEHESTMMCSVSLVGQTAPNHQFCTNHGTCVKLVSGGEPHPGCICKDGWMGNHCEIMADPFAAVPAQKAEQGGNNTAAKVLISALVVGLVALAVGVGFLIMRAKKAADADSSALPGVFQGEKSSNSAVPAKTANGGEKKVLGEGDLDPDGSATLGEAKSQNPGDTDGLMAIADGLENEVV
jgi:hypothetical protein